MIVSINPRDPRCSPAQSPARAAPLSLSPSILPHPTISLTREITAFISVFYDKIIFRLTLFKLFICNYLKTQLAHFTFPMLHSCQTCSVFLKWGKLNSPGSQPGLQLHPGCSIQASRHDGPGGDLHQGGVSLQAAQQLRADPGRQIHPQISGRWLRPDRGESWSGCSFVTVSDGHGQLSCGNGKKQNVTWFMAFSSSLSFYIYVFKEHSVFCHYYFPLLTEEPSKDLLKSSDKSSSPLGWFWYWWCNTSLVKHFKIFHLSSTSQLRSV